MPNLFKKKKTAENYLPDLVAKAPGNHRILEEVRIYVASGASMDNDRFYNFCNLRWKEVMIIKNKNRA